MKKSYAKTLRKLKQRITRRLRRKNYADQPKPVFQGGNLRYEVAGRTGAVSCGGLGAMHTLAQRLGLVREINEHLHLLKVHLPYHESDHVLNPTFAIRDIFGLGSLRLRCFERKVYTTGVLGVLISGGGWPGSVRPSWLSRS